MDQFRLDCDLCPTTKEGLEVLRKEPKEATGWHGPYFKGPIPKDEWGNPYAYKAGNGSSSAGYSVTSYGADGLPGGEGDAADIVSGSDSWP